MIVLFILLVIVHVLLSTYIFTVAKEFALVVVNRNFNTNFSYKLAIRDTPLIIICFLPILNMIVLYGITFKVDKVEERLIEKIKQILPDEKNRRRF